MRDEPTCSGYASCQSYLLPTVRCDIVEAVIIESNCCVLWLVHCGACSTNGERRGACKVLVGKPEGKIPLGRPWSRWEDNIKMDLQEVGGGMDWIVLA